MISRFIRDASIDDSTMKYLIQNYTSNVMITIGFLISRRSIYR